MTAYVTEYRQYRFFDRNLTDNLANRLLKVDVAQQGVDRPHPELRPPVLAVERRGHASTSRRTATTSRWRSIPRRRPTPSFPTATSCWCRRMAAAAFSQSHPDNRYGDDGTALRPRRKIGAVHPRRHGQCAMASCVGCGGCRLPSARRCRSRGHRPEHRRRRVLRRMAAAVGAGRGQRPRAGVRDGCRRLAVRKASATAGNTERDSGAGRTGLSSWARPRAARRKALRTGPSGKPRQLTHFNDALFAGLDLGRVESHTFPGAVATDAGLGVFRPASTPLNGTRWCNCCTADRTR
jgi:hypothetical protein